MINLSATYTDIGGRMRNFCLHLQYRNISHSPADVCTSLCNGTPNNGIHNGLIPNGILCNYGSKTRMIFKRGIIWYPINGLFP